MEPSAFLSNYPPFRFLPQKVLLGFDHTLKIEYAPRDTVVFKQNQSGIKQITIIQRGRLNLFEETGKSDSLYEVLGPGDVYGAISVLKNDSIALRTAQTQEDSFFYLMEKKDFLELCAEYPDFQDFFVRCFGQRMMQKSYTQVRERRHLSLARQELLLFTSSVEQFMRPVDNWGVPEQSIQSLAKLMSKKNLEAILIKNTPGKWVGIVTDHDLRSKVVARGLDYSQSVQTIMSSPLIGVEAKSTVSEALFTMSQKEIKSLAISRDGDIIGLLHHRNLLLRQGYSPLELLEDIRHAAVLSDAISKRQDIAKVVHHFLLQGVTIENVNRMITTINDAILHRIIESVIAEMGEPPVPFAFMLLGSEGRCEQTLATDQDNAIIFQDCSGDLNETARAYFKTFGRCICGLLDEAGFKFCLGDIMCRNSLWCKSLAEWKKEYASWVNNPDPKSVLNGSIFFDFRLGYGERRLIDLLRQYLFNILEEGGSVFYRMLAINILKESPPMGFFKDTVLRSFYQGESEFNIKHPMRIIVDIIRLHALQHGIGITNTLDRLEELNRKGLFSSEQYEELRQAYRYLMNIRLSHQETQILDKNETPDNIIGTGEISNLQRKILKECFLLIKRAQQALRMPFALGI